MEASSAGHVHVARYLLGHGANVNAADASDARTPLHLASRRHQATVTSSTAAAATLAESSFGTMLAPGLAQAQRVFFRVFCLSWGVRGCVCVCGGGDAALSVALFCPGCFEPQAINSGDVAMVRELLLSDDIDVNHQRARNGGTPLAFACAAGHLDIAKVLLAHDGVDADNENAVGVSPLFIASRTGGTTPTNLLPLIKFASLTARVKGPRVAYLARAARRAACSERNHGTAIHRMIPPFPLAGGGTRPRPRRGGASGVRESGHRPGRAGQGDARGKLQRPRRCHPGAPHAGQSQPRRVAA